MGLFDGLSYSFESTDVAVFFTLLLLEGILSFDNAAVLAAMVRRLPAQQRRKALFYGLGGAYLFRFTAILLAAFLIENSVLRIIGGAYLIYLLASHLFRRSRADTAEAKLVPTVLGLSAFWSTIVLVEMADIVFALDQIVAAVALTDKLPLIIAASFVAIIALRISATYMIRLMDWFPPLETLAYVAVGWVGVKLLLEEALHIVVPKWLAIAVTLGVLGGPVLAKLVYETAIGRRSRRATAEPAPVGVAEAEAPKA